MDEDTRYRLMALREADQLMNAADQIDDRMMRVNFLRKARDRYRAGGSYGAVKFVERMIDSAQLGVG